MSGLQDALGDRFEDLGLVATDRLGEIRRVRDRLLDRTLLLKILRNDLAHETANHERLAREARLLAGIAHPSVAPVHDLGVLRDGRPFFALGELRGQPLTRIMRELVSDSRVAGTWTPSPSGATLHRVVGWIRGLALTVAFAHERGVIHGNLSPDQVLVGPCGELGVVGFGLPEAEVEGPGPRGSVEGTPAYMPPEQAFAEPRSPAWDIYAIGAILYDALAGRPPYADPNPRDVLRRLRRGERPRPLQPGEEGHPPAPAALVSIVRRAMARDPRDRHPSASALADELAAWLEGLPPEPG